MQACHRDVPGPPRPQRRARRVALSGVLALAGLLTSGCAEGPGVDPTAEGPGVDLTAEMVQYRRDAQRDVIQVKVTNHGASDVNVRRVEVLSPTFAGPASADKDSIVGAGLSVDLTVPLVPPACDEADSTAPSPAATGEHLAVLVVDGTTVELPVDDRVLQDVRARRCAQAAVDELVDLAWEPTWADAGVVDGEPALRGRLVLTPRAPDPVTVTVAGATTLFAVDAQVEAALRGRPEAIDVVVKVSRCDPHAVAEDKKGYLFPVRVTPDGGEEVLIEVAVPPPERAPLQDLIARTCY